MHDICLDSFYGKIKGGKILREGKRLLYFVAIFFLFSLFLTGGRLEEKEIKILENVFILNWKENKIKILLDGQEKIYICDEYARQEKIDIPADIIMRGERVLQVRERDKQVMETFKVERGEKKLKNSINIFAVRGKEQKKILIAAKKRWIKEFLFGHQLI